MYHSASVHEGCLYVCSGLSGNQELSDFYSFDLETHVWRELPNCPCIIYGHTTVILNSTLILFGGFKKDENDHFYSTSDILSYDFVTSLWNVIQIKEKEDPVPTPRGFHSALVEKNCLIVFGGKSTQKKYERSVNDIWIFWLHRFKTTGYWRYISQSTIPRFAHLSFLQSEKVFVIGGVNENKSEMDPQIFDYTAGLKKPEVFKTLSTESIMFSEHPEDIPNEFLLHSACCVHDKNVYVFGGTIQPPIIKIEKSKNNPRIIDKKKILLLGNPKAGKSAFARNASLQFGGSKSPFDQKKEIIKAEIYTLVVYTINQILHLEKEDNMLKNASYDEKHVKIGQMVMKIAENPEMFHSPNFIISQFADTFIDQIQDLVSTSQFQISLDTYQNSILRGMNYFMSDIEYLTTIREELSHKDIMHGCDLSKCGIDMYTIAYAEKEYKILDASGAPEARQKWSVFLNSVPLILYFVDLTHYSEKSDLGTKLDADLQHLELLLNDFDLPILLCFSMVDILEEFLEKYPIPKITNFQDALDHVVRKFTSRLNNYRVYTHAISSFNEYHIREILKCADYMITNNEQCTCSCGYVDKRIIIHDCDVHFQYQ